jgi:hypothetical protein
MDMGVWGPHGERIERTNKFRAWVPGPAGGGRYVEVPGASCLEQWGACWEVYRTAMMMEQAASQATLDKYSGDFKEMAAIYAPRGCWHLCAQADIRCRSEYWPQQKRRMELFHQQNPQASSFDPSRPWNSVIRESVGPSAMTFWEAQLLGPARLFIIENGARQRPASAPDYGASIEADSTPDQRGEPNRPKGKGKGKTSKEKRFAKQKAKQDKKKEDRQNGKQPYGITEEGKQVCFGWNRSAKGCVDGPCPNKRCHICEKCGKQHRGINCTTPAEDRKSQ